MFRALVIALSLWSSLAFGQLAFPLPGLSPAPRPFAFSTIGTPAFIGSVSTVGNGSTTTWSPNVSTGAIIAGDLVVVVVQNFGVSTPATVSSISDGTANVYVKAVAIATTNLGAEIWYCANAVAVASTSSIVVTMNAAVPSGGYPIIVSVEQVSGVATSSPLDQVASQGLTSATSVTMTTGRLATPREIAFGYTSTIHYSATETQANGFALLNQILNTSAGTFNIDYLNVTNGAAVTYNPTWSGAATLTQGAVATFRAQVK